VGTRKHRYNSFQQRDAAFLLLIVAVSVADPDQVNDNDHLNVYANLGQPRNPNNHPDESVKSRLLVGTWRPSARAACATKR